MDTALGSDVAWVARRLREADTTIALIDAGMNTVSDIPDFRGDDGIWETEFDPASFHRGHFVNDPAGFWRDRVHLQERMFPDGVEPSPDHEAFSALGSRGVLNAVVTQNTGGLHREAGPDRVVELHGNAAEIICESCGARTDATPVFETVRTGGVPPTCDDCGDLLKPSVVLFGERLPRVAHSEASRLAGDVNMFLSLGSSLTVHPAAGLVGRATEVGSLVVVSFDVTQYDDHADRITRGNLAMFLPEVGKRIWARPMSPARTLGVDRLRRLRRRRVGVVGQWAPCSPHPR